MIEHSLDSAECILYLRPKSALTAADFAEIAATVDPYIEAHGDLAGILIEVDAFPGWDSLGATAAHFRFVRDHHEHIRKVAIVTDAALGTVAEKLASHFVSAAIRHFQAGQTDAARRWILSESEPVGIASGRLG